jgi:hypothetical protein
LSSDATSSGFMPSRCVSKRPGKPKPTVVRWMSDMRLLLLASPLALESATSIDTQCTATTCTGTLVWYMAKHSVRWRTQQSERME